MKRRPKREIQIFSLSALDLFASTMGAFIVIAMLLMPYFKKTQELKIESKRMHTEAAQLDKKSRDILNRHFIEIETVLPEDTTVGRQTCLKHNVATNERYNDNTGN